jgi:uroporphyrinogen decarboxylase
MRQAGRYQAEYREIRARYSMLELCQHPEEIVKVTLLPIEQFGMDAAILFSDIMIPLLGMKAAFDIVPGVGPVIENPISDHKDIEALQRFSSEESLPFIGESVRALAECLEVPLIGFAGAPFTLAAYLIEGKPSRDFKKVRQFMFSQPELWDELISRLVDATIDYLTFQAQSGASALQIFDSWVGALHPSYYERYLLPHMQRLFQALEPLSLPLIHFGTGTASLLPLMRKAGGDVLGVDWRTPLRDGWRSIGYDCAVQGNLDPALLFGTQDLIATEATRVLEEAEGRPGHIFNLGHGVLPGTPEENVKFLVDFVHEKSSR